MRIGLVALFLFHLAGVAAAEPAPKTCANPEAIGTSRTLEVGAAGGLHVGQKTYPQTLALADKEVVLTLDDGPLPGLTDRALDALARECVRATFFFIGRNAQASPEIVRRAARDGHTIGHHTWSHPGRTLRGLSSAAAIEEIRRGIEATQRAAGQGEWTDGRPATPFFRFPGFADTPETLAWLDSHDMVVFGADVWASDWTPRTPEAQLELVMRRLAASHGGILLLHDIHAQTVAMLPMLLRRLKQDGFRIVHLVPGPNKPPLKEPPAGWKSETGDFLARYMPLMRSPAASRIAPQRARGG